MWGLKGITWNYVSNVSSLFFQVDDMFKEEWIRRRPTLSNLSIWTLVSYGRKFDTLKKQLIAENNQVNRVGDRRRKDFVEPDYSQRPPASSVLYFEGSTIPKYDLAEVANLKGITQELKDLVTTRQKAKIRQLEDESAKKLSLRHLWAHEWEKLRSGVSPVKIEVTEPEADVKDGVTTKTAVVKPEVSGTLLQQRLYLLETRQHNRAKLRQAVLRTSNVANFAQPQHCEDEVLLVKPRRYVFPEAEEEGNNVFCYVDIPLPKEQKERWYVELERDVYCKDSMLIPILEDGRGPADEEEDISRFPAKAHNYIEAKDSSEVINTIKSITDSTCSGNQMTISFSFSASFKCQECGKEYTNVNNLKYHQELHFKTPDDDLETLVQKLEEDVEMEVD